MTVWLPRAALLLAVATAGLSLWALHDSQQPAAPTPTTDPVRVLWVRDENGTWHCEPWSTLPLDELFDRCDVTDLPDEAFTDPIPKGVPVG